MFEKCEYIISVMHCRQSPNRDNLPEFVFLGRSNVGKSSFINALTNRKMLAKTSSQPGKTRALNYFKIDDAFFFVDVPGYGYAARSYEERRIFGKSVEDYLINNDNLKVVFLLIDTFVGPTQDDLVMIDYLRYHHLNMVIIAAKCDKVPRTRLPRYLKTIKEKTNVSDIIMTSAKEKTGFGEVIAVLSRYLSRSVPYPKTDTGFL